MWNSFFLFQYINALIEKYMNIYILNTFSCFRIYVNMYSEFLTHNKIFLYKSELINIIIAYEYDVRITKKN